MEFRDLSTWKVTVPRLSTGHDGNGKRCFVFVVNVKRTDVTAQQGKNLKNFTSLQRKILRNIYAHRNS